MAKRIKSAKLQRQVSSTTLKRQRKANGSGLDGLFNKYGLDDEAAARIMDGNDSVAGLRPDKVRGIREALKTFKWKPPQSRC